MAAATAGGTAGGTAWDFGTKLATGKTWADWLSEKTGLDMELTELTNPGTWAGGAYGGWVGNNYSQLGRYTLNYLNPRGYDTHRAQLIDVYTKPLYTKPPTFFNGKKPKWYTGATDDEIRFQNGAIWAGIPEEEVPRTLIKLNSDGKTYRWARTALDNSFYGGKGAETVYEGEGLASQKTVDEALKLQAKGETLKDMDYFTTVGGEHSDYKVLKDFPQGTLWELYDEQKLNPQWMLSDKIKAKFNLKRGTLPYTIIDKIGGKNLSQFLGYRPFVYRQGIGTLKDGTNRIFYFDPTKWEKTGIINPE